MKLGFSAVKSLVMVLVGVAILGGGTTSAQAADIYWTGNSSGNWTLGANWLGGTAPTAADIATFDQTSFTNNATLNLSQYVLGLAVGNTQATPPLTLTLNASQTLYLGSSGIALNALAGGNFTITGTGNLLLTASQLWSNSSANTLTVSSNITNFGAQLTVGGSGNTLFSTNATLAGTGGLIKTGAGTLTLNTASTFTGAVFLNGGTVQLGVNSALPTTWINLGGGTLDLNTKTQTVSLLKGSSGSIALSGNASVLTLTQSYVTSYNGTLDAGTVAGQSGNLVFNGTGVLALTNNNSSFIGKTSISQGTLIIGSISSVGGGNSALGNSANATLGTIDMGGNGAATLVYAGAGSTTNRIINLAGTTTGATLLGDGSGGLVFNAGSFTATGAGLKTLTLRGNSGSSAINNTVINDIQSVIVNSATANSTALTKTDPGIWKLSADNNTGPNGYTGNTTISGGVLLLNTNNALTGQLGSGHVAGTDLIFANTATYLGVASGVLGLNSSFGRDVGASSLGQAYVTWSGSGGFAAYNGYRTVNLGAGGATMTWASTAGFLTTGNTLILGAPSANNTVEFQNPINLNSAARTIQVDNGSATIDAVLSGVLSGGTLVKTGAGTLSMNAVNTFSTGLTVSDGVLQLDYTTGASGNRVGGAPVTLNGGTLTFLGNATATTQVLGGLTPATGGSTFNVTSGNASTLITLGGITRNAAGQLAGTVNFNLTSGNIATSAANLTVNGANTQILGGYAVVNGSDWASLASGNIVALPGASYTTLSANNTGNMALNFQLQDTVTRNATNSGTNNAYNTLKITTSTTGQALTLVGDNTLAAGGLLFNSGNDYTIAGGTLRGSGQNTYGTIGGELLVHTYGAGNLTIASTIADNLGVSPSTIVTGNATNSTGGLVNLVKNGTGNLTLNGVNTYTGNTYINSGILNLAGAAGIPSTSQVILANQAGAALNVLTPLATVGSLSGGGLSGGGINLSGNVLAANILGNTTYNGVISGPAGSGLVFQSSGTNIRGTANFPTQSLYGQVTGNTSITLNAPATTLSMSLTAMGTTLHNFDGGFNLQSGVLDLGGISSVGINPVLYGPVGTGALAFTNNNNVGTYYNTATVARLSSTAALNINNPLNFAGNVRTEGGSALNFYGDTTMTANSTINVAAGGAVNLFGKITGFYGLNLLWNSGGQGTTYGVTLNNPESTFSGGVTLQRGITLTITASGDAGNTRGPLGTGTFTINGGVLQIDSTASRAIYNPVTMNNDWVWVGGSTNGLGLSFGGAVNLGSTTSGRTIYIENRSANSEYLTFNGPISGAGGLNLIAANVGAKPVGQVYMYGDNNYTGNTALTTSSAGSGNVGLILDFTYNNGQKLDPLSYLILNNRSAVGFISNPAANSSQTIAGLNMNAGTHTLSFASAGSQQMNVNLGTIARTNYATLLANQPNVTFNGSVGVSSATANLVSNSILPPWIAVNNGNFLNFATVFSGNLVAAGNSGPLPTSGGNSTLNYFQATGNLTANVVANSLRMENANLNLAGYTLSLTSGGLIYDQTTASTVTAGTIDALNGELIFRNQGSATTINAGVGPSTKVLTVAAGSGLTWNGSLTGLNQININTVGVASFTQTANQNLTNNLTVNDYYGTISWGVGAAAITTDLAGNNLTVYNNSPQTMQFGKLTNVGTLTVLGPSSNYDAGVGTVSTDPGSAQTSTINNIVWNGRTNLTLHGNSTLSGLQSVTWLNPTPAFSNSTPELNYTQNIAYSTLTFNSPVIMTGNLTFNNYQLKGYTYANSIAGGNNTLINNSMSPYATVFTNVTGIAGVVNTLGSYSLTMSTSAINVGTNAFNVETYGANVMTIANNITAGNLNVTGSGMHTWNVDNNVQGNAETGRSQVTFNGTNSFSGNTTFSNAYVALDYTVNNTAKIGGNLTLNSVYLRVTSNAAAASSLSTNLTLGAGFNVITDVSNTYNATINLGTITRSNIGAVLDIRYTTQNAAGNITANTGTTPPINGLLGGWAVCDGVSGVGGEFITVSNNSSATAGLYPVGVAGGVVANYTPLTAAFGNQPTVTANYASGYGAVLNLTANVAVNALKMTSTGDRTLGVLNLGVNNLVITTGGLLLTANTLTGTNYQYINGAGTISANSAGTGVGDPNQNLYLTWLISPYNGTYSYNRLTINAPLIGAGSGALVFSGLGEINVTAPAQYTGGTYVNAGVLGVGNLQAGTPALSSGPLVLQSGGSIGAYGSFTRTLAAGSGNVTFGPGGGGFSAEGGPLTVNMTYNGVVGGAIPASVLGRYLTLNNLYTSTDVVDFKNPIVIDGSGPNANAGLTVSVGTYGFNNISASHQSNWGMAISKISGSITGNGNLMVYGNGSNGSSGMLVPAGGLNYTGDLIAQGAAVYVDNANAFPGNINLAAAGVLASHGTLTRSLGGGAGQLNFTMTNGGFAGVGGPLAVRLNGGGPVAFNTGGFVPTELLLGSPLSTHPVDFQNDLIGVGIITPYGPMPSVVSGKISGGGTLQIAQISGDSGSGGGILILSNPGNDFTGAVHIQAGKMLRAGSSAALGAPGGGLYYDSYYVAGTIDLNGYSFAQEPWTPWTNGNYGPDLLPVMVNFNTTQTSTWGDSSPASNIIVAAGYNNGVGTLFGGPGNLVIASNWIGATGQPTAVSNPLTKRGTGNLTFTGNMAGVGINGSNVSYGTSLIGGVTKLDFVRDTGTKALFGFTGTGAPYFRLNQAGLEMDGNASVAAQQNLIQTIGNTVAVSATTSAWPGLSLTNGAYNSFLGVGGANTVSVVSRGQPTTLELYSIIRNISSGSPGTVNFTTDGSGNSFIRMSGAGIPQMTNTGTLYTNAMVYPLAITGNGTGAAGYAVVSGNVVSAICITNQGSGYTGVTSFTVPGTAGTTATGILFANQPNIGIIGGYATWNGTDWAARDLTGNIAAFSNYTFSNNAAGFTANQNISYNGTIGGNATTGAIASLRFGEAVNTTLTIGSANTLSIGQTAIPNVSPVMTGGILMSPDVGNNNVLITGGALQSPIANDGLIIHQYDTQGTLTIASNLTGTGMTVVKTGPGTLVLTGNNSFNYPLQINGGTVAVPSLTNYGDNGPTGRQTNVAGLLPDLVLQGGSKLQVTGNCSSNKVIGISTGDGVIEVAGTNTTLTLNPSTHATVWGAQYISLSMLGDNFSNLTLTGNGTGVVNGSIMLKETWDAEGGQYNGSNQQVVEGFTTLTKNGTGTWTLAGNYNWWLGGTIINQGALALGYALHALPPGPVIVNSAGTLDLLTNNEITGEIRLYGGTLAATGGSGNALSGRAYNFFTGNANVSLAGDVAALTKFSDGTVSGGTTYLNAANTYSAPTMVAGGVLMLNNANAVPGGLGATGGASNVIFTSGNVLMPGPTPAYQTQPGGVLGLTAASGDFLRPLGVSGNQVQWTGSGGFAAYGADRTANLGGSSATVTWNSGNFIPAGSALIFGAADADRTVTFQNPIDLNGTTGIFQTVQGIGGSTHPAGILSGVISSSTGTAGIITTGNGTLVLTANNTFGGGISVGGGSLLINNSVGSGSGTGSIVVNSGSTLGGVGIIGSGGASNVSLLSGALLSPGDPSLSGGIGTLTMNFGTGLLDLQAGANLVFDLATTSNDLILVSTGSVQFSGSQAWGDFTFNTQPGTFGPGVYTLMTTSSGAINGWGSDLSGLVGGYNGTLSVPGGNNLILTVIVPEPGTLALLAFGSLAVLHRRKKKTA